MDLTAGDDRSEQAVAIIRASDAGREIVAELFAGMDLDEAKTAAIVKARAVVLEQWGKAQAAFIRVGQTLLHLSRTLTEEEFQRVRRGSERLFPFGDSTATKLRKAAEFIEAHRIPAEQAPPYTITYEISTLAPEGQDLVRERGLLRPNVRRAEIVAIREELRAHKIKTPVVLEGFAEEVTSEGTGTMLGESALAAMRAEVEDIDLKIADLQAQLRRHLNRKADILRVLGLSKAGFG
ncbi:hypothetical protein [Roseomonas chloroacetimidivorans]|uniref:hypothetical protein n=1 Tax=Roseomonas chloroacetimidivorans TaxID=1766656 RepID=UPI003C75B901